MHVNSSGEIIWSNLHGSSGYDGGTNVIRNSADNVVCLGWSGASPYSSNIIAYSLDTYGSQIAAKNITDDSKREYGIDMLQTNDNGYIILAREETWEIINYNFELTSSLSLLFKLA